MFIYYGLLFSSLAFGIYFCEWKKKKSNTILYLILMGILFTILSSFRYAIGFDYYSYRTIYTETASQNILEIIQLHKNEILFYLWNKLCISCSLSYTCYLFITYLFLHSVVLSFIYRYSKLPWMSVFFYITLQFFAYSMNLFRQSIALSFFLLAYPFLVQRKIKPFFLLILVGGLFHNSLFFMLPLYFLLPQKNTKKTFLGYFVLFLFLYVSSSPLLTGIQHLLPVQYSSYFNSIYWQGNSFRYVIFPTLYLLIVFLLGKNLSVSSTVKNSYLNSAMYTFFISFFITKHFILERFSIYPFSLSILVLPEIIYSYFTSPKEDSSKQWRHSIVPFLIVLYAVSYFLFAVTEGFHNVYPYISLFDRAGSSHFFD